jgi:hypothetical protein
LNFAAIRDEIFEKVHKTVKSGNKSAYFSSLSIELAPLCFYVTSRTRIAKTKASFHRVFEIFGNTFIFVVVFV